MDSVDIVQIIQQLGIAAAALLALAWGVWRGLRWLGEKVLVPLMESHIKFLNSLDARLSQQTDLLEKIGEKMESLHSQA